MFVLLSSIYEGIVGTENRLKYASDGMVQRTCNASKVLGRHTKLIQSKILITLNTKDAVEVENL